MIRALYFDPDGTPSAGVTETQFRESIGPAADRRAI